MQFVYVVIVWSVYLHLAVGIPEEISRPATANKDFHARRKNLSELVLDSNEKTTYATAALTSFPSTSSSTNASALLTYAVKYKDRTLYRTEYTSSVPLRQEGTITHPSLVVDTQISQPMLSTKKENKPLKLVSLNLNYHKIFESNVKHNKNITLVNRASFTGKVTNNLPTLPTTSNVTSSKSVHESAGALSTTKSINHRQGSQISNDKLTNSRHILQLSTPAFIIEATASKQQLKQNSEYLIKSNQRSSTLGNRSQTLAFLTTALISTTGSGNPGESVKQINNRDSRVRQLSESSHTFPPRPSINAPRLRADIQLVTKPRQKYPVPGRGTPLDISRTNPEPSWHHLRDHYTNRRSITSTAIDIHKTRSREPTTPTTAAITELVKSTTTATTKRQRSPTSTPLPRIPWLPQTTSAILFVPQIKFKQLPPSQDDYLRWRPHDGQPPTTPVIITTRTTERTSTRRPEPQNLTDTCRTDVQCKRIHPVSVCRAPLDCSSDNCQPVCNCSTGTFINIQRNECVNLPTKLNDQCLEHHHCDSIGSSLCLSVNKSVTECKCRYGHFSNSNQTACHMYPRQFGDYCEENIHCEQHLTSNYTCDTDNHTCVCSESHKLVGIECVQRDPIPLHKMVPFQGVVPCDHTCVNWTNSQCGTKKDINGTFCQCLPRYARRYNSSQCVPVQTYVVQLELVQEASQYSYKTMNYTSEYAFQQRPPFQILANRITINGLQDLFNQSRFGSRYVSSDVMDVGPIGTHNGVKVKVLLHLTAHYMNATTEADILEEIQSVLYRKGPSNSSEPYVELGESRLRLDRKVLGSAQGINIQDYDECASRLTHDCHINATCLNTLGSYLCVCRPQFEDMSRVAGLELGRKCETRRVISLHDEACSSEDCSTTWEFVALALALFLIVLLAFIVYEIIQKKQTFTARKLYEKFGTTKIRRLRKASIARIHEVKRRQQEMRKKNKSKKQKKKDDLLTISEVDENVDVGAAVPPTRKPSSKKRKKKDKKKKDTIFSDTAISGPEEAAPSSVEATAPSVNIVHPPAMPSTDSLGMDA